MTLSWYFQISERKAGYAWPALDYPEENKRKNRSEKCPREEWQRGIDLLDTVDMKAIGEERKAVERLCKAVGQPARQEQDKSCDREPEL